MISGTIPSIARRFGTEGSKVQILSPRPKFSNEYRPQLTLRGRLGPFLLVISYPSLRRPIRLRSKHPIFQAVTAGTDIGLVPPRCAECRRDSSRWQAADSAATSYLTAINIDKPRAESGPTTERLKMEIKSDIVKTETVQLRDIDVVFGPGSGLSLTLEQGDSITIPEPLGSGDVVLSYASGEQGRINGSLVQLINQRTRTVTRPTRTPDVRG